MKKLLLTLGTVAAVVAPVASVIACGGVDGLADAKKTGIDAIKRDPDLTSSEKTKYIARINAASTQGRVNEIVEESWKTGQTEQTNAADLKTAKDNAKSYLNGIELNENQQKPFIEKINKAKSQAELDKIKDEADKWKKAHDADALAVELRGYAHDEILGSNEIIRYHITLETKAKFLEKINAAKTKPEFDAAKQFARDNSVSPSAKIASASGYYFETEDGKELYIKDGEVGTKVSLNDMDATTAQPSTTYAVQAKGANANTMPTITKLNSDGSFSNTSVSVTKVHKANANGLVLEDISGRFYLPGVLTDKTNLETNKDFVDYLNRNFHPDIDGELIKDLVDPTVFDKLGVRGFISVSNPQDAPKIEFAPK